MSESTTTSGDVQDHQIELKSIQALQRKAQ